MNQLTNIARIQTAITDPERHAAALADIKHMHDVLTDVQAENGQLKADLHREQDRCAMLIEERDRYRHGEARLRTLLIELCTQMSNISLLTIKAQEVVRAVEDLDREPTRLPAVDIHAA